MPPQHYSMHIGPYGPSNANAEVSVRHAPLVYYAMFFFCFPNGNAIPTHHSAYSIREQIECTNQKEIAHGR